MSLPVGLLGSLLGGLFRFLFFYGLLQRLPIPVLGRFQPDNILLDRYGELLSGSFACRGFAGPHPGPPGVLREVFRGILCDKQRELDAAAQKNEGKAASAPLHPPAPPQLRFADFFELNCKWLEHLAGIPIGGSSPGPADTLIHCRSH